MKRRGSARSGPATRRASERARRGARGSFARAWIAMALLAVVALAWWRLAPRGAGGHDPIATLSPAAAESIGVQYMEADRYREALPYLRRGTEGVGERVWLTHFNLAFTLGRLSIANTQRGGLDQPLERSSIERVALAREAERSYARALALAQDPSAPATILRWDAEFQFAWGRMWEAFVQFRRAQYADPQDSQLSERAGEFRLLLEHPETFSTTEEAMRGLAPPGP